jgi:hypothetical protein
MASMTRAARAWKERHRRTAEDAEAGMATAEYAIGTVATMNVIGHT